MRHGPSIGGGGPSDDGARADELACADPATAAHMERTAAKAARLAAFLELAPHAVEAIRAAAALHDIGKAGVAPEILAKPGALTRAERREVERHPLIGHRILLASRRPDARRAATIALTHHERFDGRGYPHGIGGSEIPISGRIVAVADVLDALLSDRPYRPALAREEALELLAAGSGSQFDPMVLEPALAHPDALIQLAAPSGPSPHAGEPPPQAPASSSVTAIATPARPPVNE